MFGLIKTKFTKTKFTNKLLLLWDKSKHMFKQKKTTKKQNKKKKKKSIMSVSKL